MIFTCPTREDRQIKFLVCLYLCPKNTKVRCPSYKKNYQDLKNLAIDSIYLEKYGVPEYPIPTNQTLVIKKRKRRTKAQMVEARKKVEDL